MTDTELSTPPAMPETKGDRGALLDWFRTMRTHWPISWAPAEGMCHVFRYSDIVSVLADPVAYSSNIRTMAPDNDLFKPFAKGSFSFMDAPRHRELRSLVNQAFTARVVAEQEPRIRRAARELLDALDPEHADLATGLAYPLPIVVITELLGIPAADRELFHRWTDTLLTASQDSEIDDVFSETFVARISSTVGEMMGYLSDQVALRRAEPRDDLISALVAAEIDGQLLDDEEIVGVAGLLVQSGHVTTAMLISNLILCLDENPGAMAELRARPELVPGAIDEVMRHRVPFPEAMRITTREVRLGEHTLPAGTVVVLWIASANHDETEFRDPDRFDIHRSPNQHVAFGHGVHFCMGSSLALLEARIALEMLLSRYADITVLRDAVEIYRTNSFLGVRHLPARLRT